MTARRRKIATKKLAIRKQKAFSAAGIPGAVAAPMPQVLAPQLATLTDAIPSHGEWLYEIKLDGYRLLTRFIEGKAVLITRRGNDWSEKMPHLIGELETIGVRDAWLDGEIVVQKADGTPDFGALQNSLDRKSSGDIVYFLFDVPFFQGYDLRKVELRHRRTLVEALLAERMTEHVRFSDVFDGEPRSILSSACKLGLEGIIAKRADAPYVSRRTDTWLKLKCKQRQEFVICGYVDRAGASRQVGSLILGVYENDELVPVGSVGTGWDAKEATTLKTKLAKLEQDTPRFASGPKKPGRWSKRVPGGERWVEPTLVAEVEFSEWTSDGSIRHPSYISLRSDKSPTTIVRETTKRIAV